MPEEDIKWLKEFLESNYQDQDRDRERIELTPEEIASIFDDDLDNMLERLADDYDKNDDNGEDYRLPHDFLSIVKYLKGAGAFYDIDLHKLIPPSAYGGNNVYEIRAVVNADKVNEILRGSD